MLQFFSNHICSYITWNLCASIFLETMDCKCSVYVLCFGFHCIFEFFYNCSIIITYQNNCSIIILSDNHFIRYVVILLKQFSIMMCQITRIFS